MAKIEIYTQLFCPFCARAVQLLRDKGVNFTEIDAPRGSSARREATERSGGGTTMPQLFINDASIGGCDELLALEGAGKLDALLASSS